MKPAYLPRTRIHFLLKSSIILLLCGVVLWYGFIQARPLLEGPQIALYAPTEGVISHEPFIVVSGSAANTTLLTLNGRTIHIDENGDFEESVLLPIGYTIMTLQGEDRFGRTRTLYRTLVYNPTRSLTLHQ